MIGEYGLANDAERVERFLRHLEPLQGPLEAYCRRLVHDPNGVADVLQSAVANTYRDFHLYVEGTNFRAWIFQYVHREIQNWNRRFARRRAEPLPADLTIEETWELILDEPVLRQLLEDPEAVLERCDEALASAVRSLPPVEQAILLLKAIGDFKYREIAEILQLPLGTVMSRLARCRLRLRKTLVDEGQRLGILQSPDVEEQP